MSFFQTVVLVLVCLLLGGCAAILNSDRADYSGPQAKPLWTVTNVTIEKRPLIEGGVVYAQSAADLRALDLKSGNQIWISPIAFDEVLTVAGNRLLAIDTKGLLHSLDAKTGRELAPPTPSNLLSATAGGAILYTVGKDQSVRAFDAPDHTLWTARVPMNVLFHPVLAGANLYVYGQLKDASAVKRNCAVHAFDSMSGALRWKWESEDCSGPEDSRMSTLVADADAAYLTIDTPTVNDRAGMVLALDAATGKQRWNSPTVQFHPEGPILFDASTLVVADNIPGDHGGTATRAKPQVFRSLEKSTGKVLWEVRTSSKYYRWTAAEGRIYVADRKAHALAGTGNDTSPDSFLTVVDLRSGKELWRSEAIDLASFTAPAVADGVAVFGSVPYGTTSRAAGLYAFSTTAPK